MFQLHENWQLASRQNEVTKTLEGRCVSAERFLRWCPGFRFPSCDFPPIVKIMRSVARQTVTKESHVIEPGSYRRACALSTQPPRQEFLSLLSRKTGSQKARASRGYIACPEGPGPSLTLSSQGEAKTVHTSNQLHFSELRSPNPTSKILSFLKNTYKHKGAWGAQLSKRPTADFSSGLDLRVTVGAPYLALHWT